MSKGEEDPQICNVMPEASSRILLGDSQDEGSFSKPMQTRKSNALGSASCNSNDPDTNRKGKAR